MVTLKAEEKKDEGSRSRFYTKEKRPVEIRLGCNLDLFLTLGQIKNRDIDLLMLKKLLKDS